MNNSEKLQAQDGTKSIDGAPEWISSVPNHVLNEVKIQNMLEMPENPLLQVTHTEVQRDGNEEISTCKCQLPLPDPENEGLEPLNKKLKKSSGEALVVRNEADKPPFEPIQLQKPDLTVSCKKCSLLTAKAFEERTDDSKVQDNEVSVSTSQTDLEQNHNPEDSYEECSSLVPQALGEREDDFEGEDNELRFNDSQTDLEQKYNPQNSYEECSSIVAQASEEEREEDFEGEGNALRLNYSQTDLMPEFATQNSSSDVVDNPQECLEGISMGDDIDQD